MQELKRITREDLILGKNKITMVYFEELGGELPLKPLTDGQLAQIEIIQKSGIKIRGNPEKIEQAKARLKELNSKGVEEYGDLDMELDIQQITQSEYDANVLAVQYGLALEGPPLTDRDVKNMQPPGIVKKIAEEVYKLSTMNDRQVAELESFRTE